MNARARVPLAAMWVVAAACSRGTDRERAGDEAYGAAQYREAKAAYRLAVKDNPDARVWAKIGAAALRLGEFHEATDAYLRLAGEDPTRADEAAEGLETAARAAENSGDVRTLQAAVAGLEAVAPERLAGRFTLALARRPGSDPADLVALLPAAIAAAPDPQVVDSLLGAYGAALRETSGCDAAIPLYRAVVRRSRDQALRALGGQGVAECALELGQLAEQTGRAELAHRWFAEAAAVSAAPDSLRQAAVDAIRMLLSPDSAVDSTSMRVP